MTHACPMQGTPHALECFTPPMHGLCTLHACTLHACVHMCTQAHEKVSSAITAIDGEQCFNISLTKALTAKEAETLAW